MTRSAARDQDLPRTPTQSAGPRAAGAPVDYGRVAMAADLFLAVDAVGLLAAALIVRPSLAAGEPLPLATLVAVLLAPLLLHDRRFGALASRGKARALLGSFVLRCAVLAGVLFGLGLADDLPPAALALWTASTLAFTGLTRLIVAVHVRHLQRAGRLTEVIAVVGAGAVAERLVQALHLTRPDTIDLVGTFDPADEGRLGQLVELGKKRRIDWIVLALPPTEVAVLQALVHRLKALAVPIGLGPQHVGTALPYREVGYVGGIVPLNLLAERPRAPGQAVRRVIEAVLPRWTLTLALLPFALPGLLARGVRRRAPSAPPQVGEDCVLDDYDVDGFCDLAAGFGQVRYGYAVTPNADHLIRLHEQAAFRALYAAADFILLDSRFVAHLLLLTKGIRLAVCPGSDLTGRLFAEVIDPGDALVLIGGTPAQARELVARHGLRRLAHHNPPMGFIHDPDAVEACLRFVEAHSPFRFCLLAVGSPQQEIIAQRLQARGVARGLTLCVGAAIDFLTGRELRAPGWMQRGGIEWVFRLLQAPGRMAGRYLVRGPRLFGLLRHARIVRRRRA